MLSQTPLNIICTANIVSTILKLKYVQIAHVLSVTAPTLRSGSRLIVEKVIIWILDIIYNSI